MSSKSTARRKQDTVAASTFAALGDPTRLALVIRLCDRSRQSIAQLTEGADLTRQAITKHLQVLARAGVVGCSTSGRESLYAYHPQALHEAADYLDVVSRQWDQALGRLKDFVEK
jgi:DNA-binding transcriptional ArsR family regulator